VAAIVLKQMMIPIFATAIRLLWVLIEFPYLRRFRAKPSRDWDRHSAKLWDAVNVLEVFGMILGFAGVGQIQRWTTATGAIGLSFLIIGILIRGNAIRGLGKYFTGTVQIRDDHVLIRTGPYKHIRHPAYTGALLAHLGLGLSFSNWFALGFSSIPFIAVALYRIRVEERALAEAFGSEYVAYSQTSKRLIPGVY
jgi:protein-S-isoprenylcysteine O-methyltransferase Ste14